MRNHLHPLINMRASWNYAKPLAMRDGWVSNLGLWSGSSSRVNRGMKPWAGVGESGAAQSLPASIRSHRWVEKNSPMYKAALEEEIGDTIWQGE